MAELEAGILRLPVSRIDEREVLLETSIRLRQGDRFELIVERPDGHAELLALSRVVECKVEGLRSRSYTVDGEPDSNEVEGRCDGVSLGF